MKNAPEKLSTEAISTEPEAAPAEPDAMIEDFTPQELVAQDKPAPSLLSLVLNSNAEFLYAKGQDMPFMRFADATGKLVVCPLSAKSESFRNYVTRIKLDYNADREERTEGIADLDYNGWEKLVDNLRAEASYKQETFFMRIGVKDEAIYYDLGDGKTVIRITADGCDEIPIVTAPIVFAPLSIGARPAFHPILGNTDGLEKMRLFLGYSREDWLKIVAYMLSPVLYAFNEDNDTTILFLKADAGFGKTTGIDAITSLLDNRAKGEGGDKSNEKDRIVTAVRRLYPNFGNVHGLDQPTEEFLSRLTTGMFEAFRKLYFNDEEIVFVTKRSPSITSVNNVITDSQTARRTLMVNQPPIKVRRDKARMFKQFSEEIAPAALGNLLQAVSVYLKNYESATDTWEKLSEPLKGSVTGPAVAMLAIEDFLGYETGTFAQLMLEQANETTLSLLDRTLIGSQLKYWFEHSKVEDWSGTTSDFKKLTEDTWSAANGGDRSFMRHAMYPKTPESFSGQVTRLRATILARYGYELVDDGHKGKNRDRMKHWHKVQTGATEPAASQEVAQVTADFWTPEVTEAVLQALGGTDEPESEPESELLPIDVAAPQAEPQTEPKAEPSPTYDELFSPLSKRAVSEPAAQGIDVQEVMSALHAYLHECYRLKQFDCDNAHGAIVDGCYTFGTESHRLPSRMVSCPSRLI